MIYLIDGSIDGLFTAIFNAYLTKKTPTAVTDGDIQMEIDEEVVEIQTNEEKAVRVFKKLDKILPPSELEKIFIAIKSGDPCKFTVIFNYLVETINNDYSISDNFANPHVFRFDKLVSKINLEVHRFKGFLRFSKTDNGIYYAKYYPDNDINTLLLPHFAKRYKTMPFIIHDLKHNVISAYNNGKTKTVYTELEPIKTSDEFEKLFKIYYDTIFIKERKNEKCMLNFMPKRYHKNMPEKNELI